VQAAGGGLQSLGEQLVELGLRRHKASVMMHSGNKAAFAGRVKKFFYTRCPKIAAKKEEKNSFKTTTE